jgi:hypothetical protein
VLVHGDFHGNNQVWDRDELRLVMDFATAGAAEPEYELRTFPGPGMGPGLELLTAIMRHYQQATGRQLSADRLMAWHLRQALYDTLWHSEAGIPLNDHRTPPQWVEDLAARFSALSIDPKRHQQLTSADGTGEDRHTTPRRLDGSCLSLTSVSGWRSRPGTIGAAAMTPGPGSRAA